MARRRPPPKRPAATPSSLARKNSDTRRLVTPGPSFTDTEMTGFVRALLLGTLVAGVVAFLFYPDIAKLLEHWELDTAPLQPDLQTANNGKASKGDKPPDAATTAKKEFKSGKKARSVKETAGSSKASSSSKGGGGTPKKAPQAAAKPVKEPPPSAKETETTLECTCQQTTTPDPRVLPPTPAPPKKAKPAKAKSPPKEDLMEREEEEEEEVVEEEDSEVELMEIEESADFIELDTEEDASPESEAQPVLDHSQEDGGEDDTEPVSLRDGQPITFTPVSPGDENVIRLGGRPKTGKDTASVRGKRKADKPRPDAVASSASAQNSSAKNSSSSSNDTATSRSKKPTSKAEAKSSQKTTPVGLQTDDGDSSDLDDLPPEVRNFQPTYQKTVTAKKIFADGRRIPPVELLPQKSTNSSVKVFLFNDFLSEAECDGLRRVHDKHVLEMNTQPLLCFDSLATLRKHLQDVRSNVRVTPNDFVQGTKCLNASFSQQLGEWMSGNWSYSTAFYPGESRFSTLFANRVDQAMGLDPRNGGKFQITSYPQGKAYKAHTDCILDGTDPRDRVASVLVYLDDVEDGGETKFPELGIWVKPRKGRALVWNNMSPQGVCEPHSLHVASKVNQGSKYILIRWYYYKSFYSLGKRPPEPPLPTRAAGTPRVSCDDYDNGSCRWYDEWNNDHLLDYEYKKYTLI